MSDRRPPAFSLVGALADRFFIGAGIHAEGRPRGRGAAFTPRSGAGASPAGASSVTTGGYP